MDSANPGFSNRRKCVLCDVIFKKIKDNVVGCYSKQIKEDVIPELKLMQFTFKYKNVIFKCTLHDNYY